MDLNQHFELPEDDGDWNRGEQRRLAALAGFGESILALLSTLVPTSHTLLFDMGGGTGVRLIASTGPLNSESMDLVRNGPCPIVASVAKVGSVIHLPQVETHPKHWDDNWPGRPPCLSMLVVPLRSGGEVVGVLEMGGERVGQFGPTALDLVGRAIRVSEQALGAMVRMARALERNEIRTKDVSTSDVPVWKWSVATGALETNQPLYDLLGFLPMEIDSNIEAWRQLVHPSDRKRVEEGMLTQLLGESGVWRAEYRLLTSSARWKWVFHTARVAARDDSGKPLSATGVLVDITALKEAEDETRLQLQGVRDRFNQAADEIRRLTMANRQEIAQREDAQKRLIVYRDRLRQTTEALILAEEKERQRIAARVQGDIGLELCIAQQQLRSLASRTTPPGFASALEDIDRRLTSIIEKSRTLAADLGRAALYETGLASALNELVQKAGLEFGVATRYSAEPFPDPQSQDVRVLVYGAVRELIANAIKSSAAKHIDVTCGTKDNSIVIEVSDDGLGAPPSLDTNQIGNDDHGLGLFAVRERVFSFGGQLAILSRPGGGTIVQLTVPTRR